MTQARLPFESQTGKALHEINRGLAEADRGELIDHEGVERRMQKWLKK